LTFYDVVNINQLFSSVKGNQGGGEGE